jgi:ribonuclease R
MVHRLVRGMLRGGADARGGAILSTDPQPWGKSEGPGFRARGAGPRTQGSEDGRTGESRHAGPLALNPEPFSAEELNDIAVESSAAERRAADAERELIEWKKMKFMADKVGDDFPAVILSCTKYGFFVELAEMFIEGLVPLQSLVGDYYSFRDTDRTIVGSRTGHVFSLGQKVHVLLDRIDRQQRRLQFALMPGTEPVGNAESGVGSPRRGKSETKKTRAKEKTRGKKVAGKEGKRKKR